jgi:protein-S-isoprenylcysteine O-methyltransferase Ste14
VSAASFALMNIDADTVGRASLLVIILVAAGIGVPHRLRADQAGGRVSYRVDPPWFWRLMAIFGPLVALSCVAFLIEPRWVDFARLPLAPSLRLTGAPIAVVGLLLFGWMFRHLGLNVTSTSMPRDGATLITTGPYRWVRHPMYSAALLLIIAASLLTANLMVVMGGTGMFALLAARSRVEEKRLEEKFNDAYRRYARRTGRFLPRCCTQHAD